MRKKNLEFQIKSIIVYKAQKERTTKKLDTEGLEEEGLTQEAW